MSRAKEPTRSEPTEELSIRLAGPEDLPQVLDLLTEAAHWSREQGIEGLWRDPYPAEWVLPSVVRQEVYLAWRGRLAVGTITFRWDDRPTWGDRPADAGYVHKFATRRSRKGEGIGSSILDWTSDRVRAAGREWLRLDCLTSHVALRAYYESLGFERVGEAVVDGNRVTLLQRRALRPTAQRGPQPRPAKGNIK